MDAENSMRTEQKLPLLASAPEVASMDDEIPYQEQICRTVMPYGLAVYLSLGDDEYSKAGFFDFKVSAIQKPFTLKGPTMLAD